MWSERVHNKDVVYGEVGGKTGLCSDHAKDGMAKVRSKRFDHSGCAKIPSYGKLGGKAERCGEHAESRMLNVREKRFGHYRCIKQPSYGVVGSRTKIFGARHPKGDMVRVDIRERRKSNGEGQCGGDRPRVGSIGGGSACGVFSETRRGGPPPPPTWTDPPRRGGALEDD